MNLKNVRKSKGFTQIDLANKLDLDQSTISKYEKNLISPNVATLKKIAEVLGCTVDELLKDTG